LHLLESPKVNDYITAFPVIGSNVVESVKYVDGKVYINASQYFGGVPEIAWTHPIGGYLPAQKWLKDRKGRTLSSDDIAHYQSMIVAMNETVSVMEEIDKL
jgi:Type ISP C-terminal specificity domain